MNEPNKPKLTDYLTEALAKSLTEEGRQSLLEERELVEAEAQRERAGGSPDPDATSGHSGGWGGSPDAS